MPLWWALHLDAFDMSWGIKGIMIYSWEERSMIPKGRETMTSNGRKKTIIRTPGEKKDGITTSE